ncbi:hypothetical protein SAY87_022289 [Trapa incisa]|uniref:Inosine/uridine-preferring nucleoside hydrolase domain-containing protein n=1 Tax=Trapa incisa TaxID=236973 RepID=A0AAN7K7G2_9MYRT|nr:hypothetical protein SAY87_022289 [Trapa incisa]
MLLVQRESTSATIATLLMLLLAAGGFGGGLTSSGESKPRRILIDTDVDVDDFFALLYLLKLNRSEFSLEAVTINTNSWSNAGHSVNHIYDILFMMGRDDVAVGIGGEGGIKGDGTILPDVGGYLPLIEQGMTTTGYCRYRQSIPMGFGGRLTIDSNYGIRKAFLPQGKRRYYPLKQPTAQQVMIDKVSAGPISIFLFGAHTNLAIFLMSQPDYLKKNIEHIYVMGGSVRPNVFTGCPLQKSSLTFDPQQCIVLGNVFTAYASNPYAEYNMFMDPFAAYQVIHSGIPVTLVPLDATNTIPVTEEFFNTFEQMQSTYEAQYCFQSLKMVRDTWVGDNFYTNYYMWDSFASGVAVSMMRNGEKWNEFAEMEYMNITVITSDEPYGITDGSNPMFDELATPKFKLIKGGVHSGHVQTGLRDPFCTSDSNTRKCKDGSTVAVNGSEAVRVLVATKAKANQDHESPLDRQFFTSFLKVLNDPQQSARFNLTEQFPYYKQAFCMPDLRGRKLGKPVIFDMDMSAGDFLTLFYLLKVPLEEIHIKAILVSPTGWANAATIDVIYDLLHMMGRDDIPVGLGRFYAANQTDPVMSIVGDCKYAKAIPHGSGGLLDSDTLYGLARDLPRSPRRFTAENSVNYGAPTITQNPELRQPRALEVWDSVVKTLTRDSKITVLVNGPLTNLADIIQPNNNAATSFIQEVYILGGHISRTITDEGNVFAIPSSRYAELNMFLDPLAAKTVLNSNLNVTLIPLTVQRRMSSFIEFIIDGGIKMWRTPESRFANSLLSTLSRLRKIDDRYLHTDMFLGEIIGGVIMVAGDKPYLNTVFSSETIKVFAEGDESKDGYIYLDRDGKLVAVLENLDPRGFRDMFWDRLADDKQSAVIGSFEDQTRMWSSPPDPTISSRSHCFPL